MNPSMRTKWRTTLNKNITPSKVHHVKQKRHHAHDATQGESNELRILIPNTLHSYEALVYDPSLVMSYFLHDWQRPKAHSHVLHNR